MDLHRQNRHSAGFWAELIKSFRLAWRLILDRDVPVLAKLIPLVIVAYILSPFDLIPDPILGLGQIDDLTLLILGTQVFIAVSPRWIVQRHRDVIDGVVEAEGSKPSSASKDIIDGK
jgi:uncharacterized membrane protein YkvA (DUF1232 family)